jgi:YfiH family protein
LRCTRLPVPHIFTSRDLALTDSTTEWSAVASSLGVPRQRLLLIHQVHGVDVAVARRGAAASWGRPQADIVITDDPDVAIGVRVADCAPVLLYDGKEKVAGAVHAGWRGTARGAVAVAVLALRREFGSEPGHIFAAIGPCLDACCGEVGPDVVAAFRSGNATNADVARWFTPGRGDRAFLDLPRANADQLVGAGVPPDQIFDSGLCTKTHHERLHSYRAARHAAGRLLGALRVGVTSEI